MEREMESGQDVRNDRPPSRSPLKFCGTPGFTCDLCEGAEWAIKVGGVISCWGAVRLGSSQLLNLSNRHANISCVDLFAATCSLSPSSMFWSLSESIASIGSVGGSVDSRDGDGGEQGTDWAGSEALL